MKEFTFEYVIPWVETDALGIVHFSNYFRLCERTEQEFFNSLDLGKRNLFLPRVHAECDYKSPLKFNQKARVILKINEIGNRHLTLDYEIWNSTENKLSAHCNIVIVPVNSKMEPANLDNEILKKLNEYTIDQMK